MPGSKLEVICWSAPTVGENLAMEDTLARAAWQSGRRVLRFWWGGPPAVVMGSSERPGQVVDEAACARLRVDVLKRSTGGGAVLQTSGVLNYSLVAPAPTRRDLKGTFRLGTDLICAILDSFGFAGTTEGTFRCCDRQQEDFRQCTGLAVESASRPWNAACRLRPCSGRSCAETSAARAPIPVGSLSP